MDTYPLTDCVQAGGAETGTSFALAPGTCVTLPEFMSFQGGYKGLCPAGKTGDIKAYSGVTCDGNSVDAGTLPLGFTHGACEQITVNVGGSVSAGGQSAMFNCV